MESFAAIPFPLSGREVPSASGPKFYAAGFKEQYLEPQLSTNLCWAAVSFLVSRALGCNFGSQFEIVEHVLNGYHDNPIGLDRALSSINVIVDQNMSWTFSKDKINYAIQENLLVCVQVKWRIETVGHALCVVGYYINSRKERILIVYNPSENLGDLGHLEYIPMDTLPQYREGTSSGQSGTWSLIFVPTGCVGHAA